MEPTGILIYSDPAEDFNITVSNGYKPYPYGPARHPGSVQRGSVQDISLYPGDPLTPGYPSYKDAKRSPIEETPSIPKIPSLPLSYTDALPLLQSLNGKGVRIGKDWQGGLGYEGVEYWTGGTEDELQVEIVNEVDQGIKKLYNLYAYVPGEVEEELVIVGNHRDAWVFGANDPISGLSSMYEVVRGLGHLLKKGWKPRRSLLLANWDGEEVSAFEYPGQGDTHL